jgi:hypothetical protein
MRVLRSLGWTFSSISDLLSSGIVIIDENQ